MSTSPKPRHNLITDANSDKLFSVYLTANHIKPVFGICVSCSHGLSHYSTNLRLLLLKNFGLIIFLENNQTVSYRGLLWPKGIKNILCFVIVMSFCLLHFQMKVYILLIHIMMSYLIARVTSFL